MRYRSIITEILFIKIRLFEIRMNSQYRFTLYCGLEGAEPLDKTLTTFLL